MAEKRTLRSGGRILSRVAEVPALPNGPGIELPAAGHCTKPHPAAARRAHPEPGGRRLDAQAGRPSGGRSAPMPC
jgi:hypothetical protein